MERHNCTQSMTNLKGEKYKDQEQVHRICLSASTGKREMMHVMYRDGN